MSTRISLLLKHMGNGNWNVIKQPLDRWMYAISNLSQQSVLRLSLNSKPIEIQSVKLRSHQTPRRAARRLKKSVTAAPPNAAPRHAKKR